MSKFDHEYIKLCKEILENGTEVENRTGINTIKIPGYTFSHNVGEEFPILTTKQVFYKNAISEILWIYQAASNDGRWLHERGNHIWDEWLVDEDGVYRIYPQGNSEARENVVVKDLDGHEMYRLDGKYYTKENAPEGAELATEEGLVDAKYYGVEAAHTIGTAYGWIVNRYDLVRNLINTIKNNPTDRRMIMSLWQNEFLKTAVLPSCVYCSEWDVTDGKLNAWVHQRSCDVPLGLPFNVTQYAVLQSLIAHCTGLEPGMLYWSIKDAHIYVNQVEGIKEQIQRYETLEDLDAPYLWLNPEKTDFFEFDNKKDNEDIKILEYKHHGKISFPIAQ